MDLRKTPLISSEYYHVFNRGVAKMPTFIEKRDYEQLVSSLNYYNHVKPPMKFSRYKELSLTEKSKILDNMKVSSRLVEVVCYALMPNHLHILIKQLEENGISIFMSKLTNSYTKYFNTKHERVGPLFQGRFKSVHIESEDQLMHVSRYIHLNPLTSYVVDEKKFLDYPWSSLKDYYAGLSEIISPKAILSKFSSFDRYLKFILDQKDYQRRSKQIEHLIIEK